MSDDVRKRSLYIVAEHLHKGVWELSAMPNTELVEWLVYLRLKSEK